MSTTWICEHCKTEFELETNSEDERIAELQQNFGKQWHPHDCVKVCTDCYNAFLERHNAAQN